MLYWIFSAGFLFFVYCGSNFDGRKDLTFYRFRVNIPPTANSPSKFLVRGVFLRPHLIPQSFSEHMETVETRGLQSKWFPDERATKCLKCGKKYSMAYLGPRCRRFEPCHLDQTCGARIAHRRFFYFGVLFIRRQQVSLMQRKPMKSTTLRRWTAVLCFFPWFRNIAKQEMYFPCLFVIVYT